VPSKPSLVAKLPAEHHLLRLRADSTPYTDDPPTAGAYYQAIGVYMVAWGRFEGHFVATLLTLRAMGWDSIPREGMPLAWEKRADFWKKAFRTLPQLAPIQADALALIADVIGAAKSRGVLVHSMWGAFLSGEPLAMESINMRFEGRDVFAVGNIAVTLPTIEHMILGANTLNARLIPLSAFLEKVRPVPGSAEPVLRPRGSLRTPPKRSRRGQGQPRSPGRRR
jgi:hypothetical protein